MEADSFDCRTTAAVLRSGGTIAVAGHVAVAICVFAGHAIWIKSLAVLFWCAVVYLSVRVKIDAELFELLASQPAARLDDWLAANGLRKQTSPRTMVQRQRGAMLLWRGLVISVAVEIALLLIVVLRLPA